MKRLMLTLLMFVVYTVSAQDVYMYTAYGNKVYFGNTNKIIVSLSRETIVGENSVLNDSNRYCKISEWDYVIPSEDLQSLQTLYNIDRFDRVYNIDGTFYWPTSSVFIKVKKNDNVNEVLNELSIDYNEYEQFGSDTDVYLVELDCSGDSVVSISNKIYQSGKVIYAQPDWNMLMNLDNPYYSQQWGLHNNGSGYDINVEDAWNITTGYGIKIAIVDVGVDANHPDLINNMLGGYDATCGAYSGSEIQPLSGNTHGTKCAGVAAAVDNNIGIKGVAYDSRIIPIRVGVTTNNGILHTKHSWKAMSIYKAWHDYEADVISCSWSSSGDSVNVLQDEINNAFRYGRGGKGAVVVFSAGNDLNCSSNSSTPMSYTARMDNVIAVGAMAPCGMRVSDTACNGYSWCSKYGDRLWVVAPGTDIYTTTLSNVGNGYVSYFDGTSASCPMVAGVAALMLSANPYLNAEQVKGILGETAVRVNRNAPYVYGRRPGYIHGDWNCEMGYGLVDAGAAVQSASDLFDPIDLYIKDAPDDDASEPYMGDYMIGQSPDIVVKDLSGNVVDRVTGGQQYRLEVTVRNCGNRRSTGYEWLQVEWAWANTIQIRNLNHQTYTHQCYEVDRGWYTAVLIPAINPGCSTVVSQIITAPSVHTDGCHYATDFDCPLTFTAWVNDNEYIPGSARDYVYRDVFVINNNNAAMKELVLMSDINDVLPIMVQNLSDETREYSVGYKSYPNSNNQHLMDVAEVTLTMSDGMYNQWVLGGMNGYGYTHLGDGVFLVTDKNVWFEDIEMSPWDSEMLTVKVRSYGHNNSSDRFDFDVWQRCTSCDECNSFGGTLHTFYQGVTDHNIKPIRSISETDSTADNDTITVINKLGTIISINPNPAESEVQVTYQMSESVSSATLTISNAMGAVVRTVATNATGITILNLQGLPSGLYYVQLGTSSEVFDVKTLIVR